MGSAAHDPTPSTNALDDALRSLFPAFVEIVYAVPAGVDSELYPEEREYIARAVPKRQAEFGTARVCARRALSRLGVAAGELVPHADRSPRWPPGIVGSIAHTEAHCAVAVARASSAGGLGLDIEQDSPLDPALQTMICTTEESRFLSLQPGERRGSLAKLFFSAKEAFYKCQYPMTHTFLDFKDIDMNINLDENTFAIAKIHRRGPEWSAIQMAHGRFHCGHGAILTAATLPAPPPGKGEGPG